MKRKTVLFLLTFIGMAAFAQSEDMSYYTGEYNRPEATFHDRLELLQTIQDAGLTGIGEFYHNALKVLLSKYPDIRTKEDREDTDASARIICNGLAAEKYAPAAADLWQAVERFDVIRDNNQGLVMQDALIALGQTGDRQFVPYIVLRLNDFNTEAISDVEVKRKVQRAVVGAIGALEALRDPAGFRPVFFVSTGWYDPTIKNMASIALPNITDDPSDIIIEIIQDPSNAPPIKYEAWRDMLRTGAPNESKAKVAAAALAAGWNYSTSTPQYQRNLTEMRMSAIDILRQMGVPDDSVYVNLDKSYSNNFNNAVPNYDEIKKTLDALGALKTDQAVQLLIKYLREINGRRQSGIWGNKEKQMFNWLVPSLGATKTGGTDARLLLTTIQRSSAYTSAEQVLARNALRELGQ
jgi:hypothetical protein